MSDFSRGDVWLVSIDPGRGREQSGIRPVLLVSDDRFNNGPAELVIAIPLTTRDRALYSHIRVEAPEGGLKRKSFVMCEQIRNFSRERMLRRLGRVEKVTMFKVENILQSLLYL